ncbi:hypothetical protein GJ496_008491 [Pomphorhynchus laevis]|nr:hypothetical protein GJ496_008491 [Pomphorhynchus laevis]
MDDKLENHMTVRDKLSILHPEAGELTRSLVLSMPLEGVCDHYSEVFQCIDSQMIQSISKTVQGSCGPSGLRGIPRSPMRRIIRKRNQNIDPAPGQLTRSRASSVVSSDSEKYVEASGVELLPVQDVPQNVVEATVEQV